MANWFSSAANVFRREESNGPQPFQLACLCGLVHSGLRRQRHQHLVCKSCGATVFVLPGDVYPPPRETKRKVQSSEREAAEPAIDDGANRATKETQPGQKSKRQQPLMSMPTIAERPPDMVAVETDFISVGPTKKKDVPKAPEPEPPPPGETLADALKRTFSPFRLIVAGVVLLLAVTALWSLQKRAQRNAAKIVESEIEMGREAVEDQQWVDARDHFARAVDAFDLLGRSDEQAAEVRQLHRETRVLTRLTTGSLFEVIDAGDQFLKTGKPEEVGEFLRGKFGVDWFVIDGPVRRRSTDPEREKKVQYPFEVLLPWRPESNRQVQIQVDFECLAPLVSEKESKRLLIAGKFGSCRLEGETWVFQLAPESGFLWVHPATYRALGIPADPQETDEALRKLMAQQASAMGVTP